MIKIKNRIFIAFFSLLFFIENAFSNDALCHGSFVNPITDVCWSCLFPITIGSLPVVESLVSDTENPSMPVCACGTPFPRIGISTGFWEPMAMTDVTRHPFCMVNLGGFQLNLGLERGTGKVEAASSDDNASFYYVHWYRFPLLYWLNLIIEGICLDKGDLDIAYLTEFDSTWNDDELGFIVNPEALLFGNLLAEAACAADSLAASISKPIDALFWCAGAQGSMYPLNGYIQEHVGGVQASLLLTERMAYKLHRDPPLLLDSVAQNSPLLCYTYPTPIIPKSRYRYQMINPVPTTGQGGCHPFGATTATWGAGHEIPFKGEDFGYLVFRKRNCCAL
ncbi:MAG: hypothetical protein K0R24_340 [Gammaproteobacteria bacterium]|jgi:conjugal transfer pilus assembly protein TraU|nr:hypothetical protein [Gammaproteobacteria bacterium]